MNDTVNSLLKPVVNKIHSIQARRLTPFIHCSKINACLFGLRELPPILLRPLADNVITVSKEKASRDLFQAIQDMDEFITQCCSENCLKCLLSNSIRRAKHVIFELRINIVKLLEELGFDATCMKIIEEEMESQDAVDVKRIAQLLLKVHESKDKGDVYDLLHARFASLEALGISTSQLDAGNVTIPELPDHLNLVYRHDEIEIGGDQIGSGQTGVVMLGTIKATGQKIAVKVMTRKSFSQAEFDAYQREINTLSVLDHPNLLKFYGYTKDSPFWILTDYVPKGSLYHILRDPVQRLNGTERSIIACDIADGLLYLHQNGIIHRDMKSLNVLLTEDNRAKICDFGLARTRSNQPMTGLVGTAHWMAPEVLLSTPTYDEKVDVYSFGVILWELLTGDIPYHNMPTAKVAILVIEQDMRPPLPPNGPTHLIKLIQSCWEKDPAKRPSMKFVAQQLRKPKFLFPGTDEMQFIEVKARTRMNGSNGIASTRTRRSMRGCDLAALVARAELSCNAKCQPYIKELLDILTEKKAAEEAASAGAGKIIERVLMEQTGRSVYAMEKLRNCPSPQIFDVPVLRALLLYAGCSDQTKKEMAMEVLLNACGLRFDFLCSSESFLPAFLAFFKVHISCNLAEKMLELVRRLICALDNMPPSVFGLLVDMILIQPENVKLIVSCLVSTLRFDSVKTAITPSQWITIMQRFDVCSPIMVQYCDSTTSLASDSMIVDLLFQYGEYSFISTLVSNSRFGVLVIKHLPIGGDIDKIAMLYRSIMVNYPNVVSELAKYEEFYEVTSYAIESGSHELICASFRKFTVSASALNETDLCATLARAIKKESKAEKLVALMAACFSILKVEDVPEFLPLHTSFEAMLFSDKKSLRMPAFLCLSQLARYCSDISIGNLVVSAAYYISVDSTLMREVSSSVIVDHLSDSNVNLSLVLKMFIENFRESLVDDNVRKVVVALYQASRPLSCDKEKEWAERISEIHSLYICV